MFDGSTNIVLEDTFLNILMNWHLNDPVSQKEIDRNNQVYLFQGNRNPFVDQPDYVEQIWSSTNDTENPTTPTNIEIFDITDNTLQLSWDNSTDNISVASYNIFKDDSYYANTQNNNYSISGLISDTYYCFSVAAIDQSENSSAISQEECATTLEQSTSTNELFISEYIEGSSNNKAIEIANFTGATINLEDYSLARNTNSGSSWGEMLQLTGEIADENVHVISRGNADEAITGSSNQLSSSDAISFNGDDPVGLFKNNTLIDVFGFFNGENDYANSTYVRVENVLNPTVNFDIEEWDLYPNNSFEYLGFHNQNLNVTDDIFIDFKIFPNPTKDNVLFIKSNLNYSYEIFNIQGIRIKSGVKSGKISKLDNLKFNKGVYFIKVSSNNFYFTKKIIFN